jgi:large repetitive protein
MPLSRLIRWFKWGLALWLALGGLAHSATVHYVYDGLGRLIAEIDPAGDTTIYSYDPVGNLLSVARNPQGAFRLDSFSPSSGKTGDQVIVLGAGFIANAGQNTVRFNGTLATVSVATPNALFVSVPAGASSGPISVSNINGSATSSQPFRILSLATVAGTTPGFVLRGQTSRIVISGSNLDSATAVRFDQPGFDARIVAREAGSLTIDLTVAGNVPFGAYPFSVANFVGTNSSGAVTISVTAALVGDAMSVSRRVSVHLPSTIVGAPPGNAMSMTAKGVTVHLPAVTLGAPPGNAMSVTQPVTVLRQ